MSDEFEKYTPKEEIKGSLVESPDSSDAGVVTDKKLAEESPPLPRYLETELNVSQYRERMGSKYHDLFRGLSNAQPCTIRELQEIVGDTPIEVYYPICHEIILTRMGWHSSIAEFVNGAAIPKEYLFADTGLQKKAFQQLKDNIASPRYLVDKHNCKFDLVEDVCSVLPAETIEEAFKEIIAEKISEGKYAELLNIISMPYCPEHFELPAEHENAVKRAIKGFLLNKSNKQTTIDGVSAELLMRFFNLDPQVMVEIVEDLVVECLGGGETSTAANLLNFVDDRSEILRSERVQESVKIALVALAREGAVSSMRMVCERFNYDGMDYSLLLQSEEFKKKILEAYADLLASDRKFESQDLAFFMHFSVEDTKPYMISAVVKLIGLDRLPNARRLLVKTMSGEEQQEDIDYSQIPEEVKIAINENFGKLVLSNTMSDDDLNLIRMSVGTNDPDVGSKVIEVFQKMLGRVGNDPGVVEK